MILIQYEHSIIAKPATVGNHSGNYIIKHIQQVLGTFIIMFELDISNCVDKDGLWNGLLEVSNFDVHSNYH